MKGYDMQKHQAFETTRFFTLMNFIQSESNPLPESFFFAWAHRIFPALNGESRGSMPGTYDADFYASCEQVDAFTMLLHRIHEGEEEAVDFYQELYQYEKVDDILSHINYQDRKTVVKNLLSYVFLNYQEDKVSESSAFLDWLLHVFRRKPTFSKQDAKEALLYTRKFVRGQV